MTRIDNTNNGFGKVGAWLPVDGFSGYSKKFKCSVCGATVEIPDWTARPNDKECNVCGAQMNEGERKHA